MVESDEEQLEVLKNWWDENGTSLITTVVLALGVVFGYRAWEHNVRETGEAASSAYENLVQATSDLEDENLRTTALSLGEELKTEYDDSTYATFAAMHLAKIAIQQGDLVKAQAELEWAISQKPEQHLESIARMRLARVLVAKGDPSAAMAKLLNYEPSEGQQATWEEVKGDVFVALGDNVNARQSYQMALEHLGDGRSRPLLELKLADIPVTSEMLQPEEDA
ncbi:uncharacterized protein METZ01_LOCUS311546 [marine metagenome]|uniref:Ancillary SecYEG translocon subunit n=1 Tax=marine metagenome TaxID=408172 RepID=A0A382NG46_9ZZZZ